MSKHDHRIFDPACEGCQPAVIDPQTGLPAPDDSDVVKAVMKVWRAASFDEQRAFHAVTVLNSCDPLDRHIMQELVDRIEATQ